MVTRSYRFGDLREKLRESTQEFKPVIGKGVDSAEKDLNRKAYRDIEKETEDYNKGIKHAGGDNDSESLNAQLNMGMSDIEYDTDLSEEYQDNVKAGYEGYTSALDKKNHESEALGNASRNTKLAKALVNKAKQTKREKDSFSEIGLNSRMMPPELTHLHQSVVGESKKTRMLKFKHVQFVSEGHMLSHVPDEYKKDGSRFYMQDCKGNRYLVEWHDKPEVERMLNEQKASAEMDRIKELFSYGGKDSKTTNSLRVNEGKEVEDMLGRVRGLMK